MKFKSFLAFLFSLTLMTSSQEAAWASDVGGWALVDPSTGEVMGVHVCDPSVCGPNGSFTTSQSTMNELSKNAGCSVTCVYVPQSTADQNGNVAGYSTSGKDQNPNTPIVTYDFAREIFKIESNNPFHFKPWFNTFNIGRQHINIGRQHIYFNRSSGIKEK